MLLRVYRRWLVVTAAAYAVFHHLGQIHGGLGPGPSDTQWIDWIDLLEPFLVLGPAAAALKEARADARTWLVFGIGAVTYATGHGVHLAANSVGNAAPGPTEHLWDEVVGHYVWYAGVAIVVVSLAMTMAGQPRPSAFGCGVAALAGLTWATNAVGGGTVVSSLVVALAAVVYGWRRREDLTVVLGVAGGVAAITLIGTLLVNGP
jgi:hypothetical protein